MSNQSSPSPVWAIVPAAGCGSRMGQPLPKQYLPLGQQLVIEHTLERLLAVTAVTGVVVAISDGDQRFHSLPVAADPKVMTTLGGRERSESVLAGLNFLQKKARLTDWVLVHDAARCCVRPDAIARLLATVSSSEVGGILGVPASDTLKQVQDQQITATVDRNQIWQAQTPQLFRYGLLRDALQQALQTRQAITDEASAVEAMGLKPQMVMGHYDNIKITHPEDLVIAGAILNAQESLL